MFEHDSDNYKKLQAVKAFYMSYRSIFEPLISFTVAASLLVYALPSNTKQQNTTLQQIIGTSDYPVNRQQIIASNAKHDNRYDWNTAQLSNVQLFVLKSPADYRYKNISLIDMNIQNDSSYLVENILIDIDTYSCAQQTANKQCTLIQSIKDSLQHVGALPNTKVFFVNSYVKVPEIKKDAYYEHIITLKSLALREYIAADHQIDYSNVDTDCTCCGSRASLHKKQPTMLASNEELNTPQARGC
jgi:hypothetical protein